MNIIEAQNLSKNFKVKIKESGFKGSLKSIFSPKFENINAVNSINFSVKKGEILAFIGPNGAGKSTTIKMLTSILHPDSGNIKVLGLNPVKKRKQLAYKIGTVFGQKEQLWSHLTPYDNFKFFAAIYDIENNKAKKRISELNKLFEFQKFINTPVKSLSLGQRIRCEIAASIIHNPEILFLDEPTIGLDPVVKEKIRVFIKTMNKEYQTTVFLTSHDIGDIEKLCKRIIIMNNGKIVTDSLMENLRCNYLTKKILEIKIKGAVELTHINGLKILKDEESIIRAEVDTSKRDISEVLKTLDYENIVDITISNIPLENIISEIYSSKGEV
ncbi:MAG: ATP-binding cassette domain-containing protein [Oscillospiraceae bacterium]|nr:ATP-binding cassette domain-containing protein [Oscillospiraceae bacterium]